MKALQIFQIDSHPSQIKGVGRSKEGFSLYNLLDRCQTNPGRRLLKEWFIKPLRNIVEINYRLTSVEFFTLNSSKNLLKKIRNCLWKIKDFQKILLHLNSANVSVSDWYFIIFNIIIK